MIKTIFVPISGSTTDDSLFATALALARPLAAHLDFYHVRRSPCEAAIKVPAFQFCPAVPLNAALTRLDDREEAISAIANQRFEDFCSENDIPVVEHPSATSGMSAWRLEEADGKQDRFIFHARHHDLVILGRPHAHSPIRDSLIESVLMHCGRPVIIAPEVASGKPIESIVVGWNESAAAAHALAAAMPLLKLARSVLMVRVGNGSHDGEGLTEVTRQLGWHGVRATCHVASNSNDAPVAVRLLDAAEEMSADLLVAGGYGHSPLREIAFGGVTQSLIERTDFPVLLMH